MTKHSIRISAAILTAGLMVFSARTAHAAAFTATITEGSGNNWFTNAGVGIWQPGNTQPAAGNTYELIANATAFGANVGNCRIRNPAFDGVQTFPGDWLKLNTNTEVRFKKGPTTPTTTVMNFPGVGGAAGLILNGGVLNTGDDATFLVTGIVQVAASSKLSAGNNGGGEQQNARALMIGGVLTGSGDLVIIQSGNLPHQIVADARGYSGNWVIQDGFLRFQPNSVSNSVGSGNILVTPTNQNAAAIGSNYCRVEFMYDVSSPGTLILSNNSVSGSPAICVLHQNCAFNNLIINGVALSAGIYSYATLNATYPVNFPAGGSGSIRVGPPVPAITLVTPPNGTQGYPASSGITVTMTSALSIDTNHITLFLNGSNASAGLIITGTDTNATVTYNGLATNVPYSATLSASNSIGVGTITFGFDTFSHAASVFIEAEDYNFSDGDCGDPSNPLDGIVGGMHQDNPAPGYYSGHIGILDTDYHDLSTTRDLATTNAYRLCDYVGTKVTSDALHAPFTSGGFPDYDVWQIQTTEWLNYTRTFPSGNYNVYLRAASTANVSFELDKVSGDLTSPSSSQTASAVGNFNIANTGGAYRYIPLTDALGSNAVVNFAGCEAAVRLTALNAANNVQLNYFVFVPVKVSLPPSLSTVNTGIGATNIYPDAVVSATIVNGDTHVALGTIVLKVNGVDVTSSATVQNNGDSVMITYDPPGFLGTNATYSVMLTYSDDAGTPKSFTNTWSFTTLPVITVLPASYGTPPGSGSDGGFNIAIHKAPNSAPAASFPNTIARAEAHLQDLIIDPSTGAPFVNEVAPGLTTEPNVINYEQSGGATVGAGWFYSTNGYPDAGFPLVTVGDARWFSDPNFISLAATAYLELTNGVYRFGVRSDDNFRLTAGPVFGDTNLVMGVAEVSGGRGDAPTEFDFEVQASGVYAFRLLYEEGSGGASLEFYSVDRVTGARTLINDPATPTSVKAFSNRTGTPLAQAPQFVNISPANNTFFVDPGSTVSFEALAGGSDIDASGVHLSLNGVDVSGSLSVGGTPSDRTASFSGLAANVPVTAVISVTDQGGHTASKTIHFDTFNAATSLSIEAEDYNFADVTCPTPAVTGGTYIDNPAINAYAGLQGIDFFDTAATLTYSIYRNCDFASTHASLDALRPAYVSAAATDYEIWQLQTGDWMNYTRTFAAATYRVYARVASSAARELQLARVTSDPSVSGQTTLLLGGFHVPNTGGGVAYQYVPLSDAFGNPIAIGLSGTSTLRLTALSANTDVQVNFLIFVPVTGTVPPAITSLSPTPGDTAVGPDALVTATLVAGSSPLSVASLHLLVDGADVTSSAVVSSSSSGASVTYTPPTFFATGTVHTASIAVADTGGNSVSNQWGFSIAASVAGQPIHVNFAAGAGNSAGNPVAPTPAGYVQDIGQTYADRGNGLTYGWNRDVTADGRYRQSANSPDLRYDTLVHLQKALPSAIWEIAVPNGSYHVHAVGGDPTATDAVFQYLYENTVQTATYTPVSGAWWCDFTSDVTVSDGRLTVNSGASASNNKICFLDITPFIVVVPPTVSRPPVNQTVSVGGTATFSVSVRGSAPLTYQWLKDNVAIGGQTGSTLTINNAQLSDQASYSVFVTNSAGNATSAAATLTVQDTTPTDLRMSIGPVGTNVVIAWTNSANGFTLLESSTVGSGAVWTTNTTSVVVSNGQNTVTIPAVGTKFFKLVH